jgi:hypothetical protein
MSICHESLMMIISSISHGMNVCRLLFDPLAVQSFPQNSRRIIASVGDGVEYLCGVYMFLDLI